MISKLKYPVTKCTQVHSSKLTKVFAYLKNTLSFRWKIVLIWMSVFIFNFFFWNNFLSSAFPSEWIPKDKWRLVYVSSEQLIEYDEKAINAFDNNPATHWFSRWKPDSIPYPQEIQINLGSPHTLDSFSYLTRQTSSKNGRVKGYKFYVSTNTTNWGLPVAEGSFPDVLDIQIVKFNKVAIGQYIKFVALSDYSGSTTYAQAAEIGVKATPITDEEIPWGNVKLTFTPSPDTRVTGHKVYWLNSQSNQELNRDVLTQTTTNFVKADFLPGIVYKFTATAYATIDGKFQESVRSDPYYVKFIEQTVPITYIINASAGAGGTISPSGNITVVSGNSHGFTMTPNTGQKIKDVLVDGKSVGAVNTYTVSNVTSNRNISANFETIINSGGSLIGLSEAPSSILNLTLEGVSDWAHWGSVSATSVNRKALVTQKISNFTRLGANAPGRFADARVAYSWNDGTPTVVGSGTTTGIHFSGLGSGYQLTIPANTVEKTFKVYLGSYKGKGRFEASLSDNSAQPYVTYIENLTGAIDRVITIKFKGSTSTNLIVKYTLEGSSGNITLQAATLNENIEELVLLPPSKIKLSVPPPN